MNDFWTWALLVVLAVQLVAVIGTLRVMRRVTRRTRGILQETEAALVEAERQWQGILQETEAALVELLTMLRGSGSTEDGEDEPDEPAPFPRPAIEAHRHGDDVQEVAEELRERGWPG